MSNWNVNKVIIYEDYLQLAQKFWGEAGVFGGGGGGGGGPPPPPSPQ